MKTRSHILLSLICVGAILLGCNKDGLTDDNPENSREKISLDTRQDIANEASKSFAFDLLEQIESESDGKSYFFSPLSVVFELGMIAAGSGGETEKQIHEALGMDDLDALNSYAEKMLSTLPGMDKTCGLSLANMVLLDQKATLKDNYSNTVKRFYKTDAKNMDFSSSKTSSYINNWISTNTKGKIEGSLKSEILKKQLIYLANAIYFEGDWANKFKSAKKEAFAFENGETHDVDMMNKTKAEDCFFGSHYADLKMTYGNGSFIIHIILPSKGYKVKDIIANYREEWQNTANCTRTKLVKLPKFKTSSFIGLTVPLMNLGLTAMFDPSADLGGMTSFSPMIIPPIGQTSYIELDESGTKAAALTETLMNISNGSTGEPFYEFIADRPFLYMIVEQSTKAILFMGKYTGK